MGILQSSAYDARTIMDQHIKFNVDQNSNEIKFCIESETNDFSKETTAFVIDKTNTYFATYWKPKCPNKGLIFICHGYAEYIGPNYEEMAQHLCKMGFLVFGHDHKGHGRSSGSRVLVKSMDDYVKPVISHILEVKSWSTNKDKP